MNYRIKLRSATELLLVAIFAVLLIANSWMFYYDHIDFFAPLAMSVLITVAFLFFVRNTLQRDSADALRTALFRISETANSSQDLRELFRFIREIIAEIVPGKRIYIALYDETKKTIDMPEMNHTEPRAAEEDLSVEELIDRVIRSGDRVVIYRQSQTNNATQSVQANISAAEHLAIPLHSPEGEMLGALVVQADPHGKVISAAQMEMLNIISHQVALVIYRKQTELQLMRLNAELELRVAERSAEVRDLYDQAPCGYHSLDKDGVFVEINETELKWLGYSREEVVGKLTFRSLLTPESVQAFDRLFALVQKRGYGAPVEYEVIRKNGSTFPVLVNATAKMDSEGNFVRSRATVFDITERKHQEKWQQRQRHILEMLAVGAMRDEVLNYIIKNLEDELVEAVCSILFFDMADKKVAVIAGRPLPASFVNERMQIESTDEPFLQKATLEQTLLSRYSQMMNEAGYESQWTEWILSAKAEVLGALVVHHSQALPTDEQAAELLTEAAHWAGITIENTHYRQQLRRLSTAVEQSPAAIVITDLAGTITYVNPRFTDITGYTFQEAMGKNPRILKSGKMNDEIYANLWHTISSGKEWKGEFLNKKKNGGLFWESASITPVRDDQGVISSYLAVKEDITEQKFARESLLKAKEEAELATRMKSAFLANMSHEIRTPMNAILGFTQLMLRDTSLSLQQRHFLDTVNRSGEHLLELLNDVLETSKIEAGQMKVNYGTFDVAVMVDHLDSMFRQKMEDKSLRFEVDAGKLQHAYLNSDPQKLRQILINLLGNALKFTAVGTVFLKVWTEAVNPGEASPEEVWLFFEVADTGIGIAYEQQEKIFAVFGQTREGALAGGTGLGLSISRSLARMMGGDITVDSEPGQGSCFRVSVRAQTVTDGQACPIERQIVRLADRTRKPRILIVDDEKLNREFLRLFLSEVGFDILEAEGGLAACEKALAFRPDILLMDIMMPDLDGFAATQNILAQWPEAKIIGVSARVFEESERQAYDCGMLAFVRKPFRETELLQVIGDLLKAEYEYGKSRSAVCETRRASQSELELNCLSALQFEELLIAAKRGDFYQLLELLDHLSDLPAPTAEQLREMVLCYDYEKLEQVLESRRSLHG